MNLRDRLVGWSGIGADAALGTAFATALAVQAVAIARSWGGGYWLFDCAAGAVVCGIALARRRHRARAAVAGLAVAAATVPLARIAELPREPGPAMTLGLSVLVGSVVRTLPARTSGAVAVGAAALVAGSQLAAAPSSSGGVTGISGTCLLAAVAVGLSLRLLDTRQRAIAERTRRDERLELARELHDVVAHHITGIVLQAQAAQLVARRTDEQRTDERRADARRDGFPAGAAASLAEIEAAGSDALAAMRRVVGLLRDADDAAPATPGPERLDELVKRFDGHGPPVCLRVPEGEPVWPPEVTSTVYRVVQESLTNVFRHAPRARSVTVSVAEEPRSVTVEVVDDAPPVPPRYQQRGGYGLLGMRERVETLGGTLRAGPRPGAGWSVLATLPVPVRERR